MKDRNKYLDIVIDHELRVYSDIVEGNTMMLNHIKYECDVENRNYKTRILRIKKRYENDR